MKKPLVFFIAALILVFPALVSNANAYAWTSEDIGEASISGSYYSGIAQYNTNTLLLGVDCVIYQEATATGSMYVFGRATSSGYVTGYVYWYQKGTLAGGGVGGFSAWVHLKFQAFDITANVLAAEKVVIDEHGVYADEGTWRDDSMTIPLFTDHYYKFSLWAEVGAHALGLGAEIADFGGISYGYADPTRKIQWGEINVPNIVPAHELSISYYSTYAPSREGTTNPTLGTYVYDEGTTVSVQAIPNSGSVFSYWWIDGKTLSWSNPIVITMNSYHTLQVYFRPINGGGGGGHKK